jgi:hypothetical protein
MWELYTMWVLVPAMLATRLGGAALSWAAFAVIALGAVGCVGGGGWARRVGSARVAAWQLSISGACCLLAPWLLHAHDALFAAWLALWGITVAGDSPQLSADRQPCAGAGGGQRADAGQQHRLRHLDRQHPTVRDLAETHLAGHAAAVVSSGRCSAYGLLAPLWRR